MGSREPLPELDWEAAQGRGKEAAVPGPRRPGAAPRGPPRSSMGERERRG